MLSCSIHLFCYTTCKIINIERLAVTGGLDVPMDRPFAVRDWRFGKYEMEGLQDPLSSFTRYLREGAIFRKKKKSRQQNKSTSNPALTA